MYVCSSGERKRKRILIIKNEGKDEPRERRKFGKNRKSKQYFSLQEERHAIKYRKNNKFSRSSNLNLYTKESR